MSGAKWWYLQLWAFVAAAWFLGLWWVKREQLRGLVKTVADYRDAVLMIAVFSFFGSTALLGMLWFLRFISRSVP